MGLISLNRYPIDSQCVGMYDYFLWLFRKLSMSFCCVVLLHGSKDHIQRRSAAHMLHLHENAATVG